MTKIEMTTIAQALQTKQTWVVKGFENFLAEWQQSTMGMGAGKITVLTTTAGDYDREVEKRYFIELGKKELDVESRNTCYDTDWELVSDSSFPELTPGLVRQIAPNLEKNISNYFKDLQKRIDDYSSAGQQISSLIEKLTT